MLSHFPGFVSVHQPNIAVCGVPSVKVKIYVFLLFVQLSFPTCISSDICSLCVSSFPRLTFNLALNIDRFGFSSEQYPNQKYLQLQFITRISYSQVTGQKIKGEHGSSIHVFLVDPETGDVVQDNRFLVLQLRLSALEGDFGEEASNDWTSVDFEENEIKDASLMTGDLEVTLEKGMGTLGALTFNDDSSTTRSGKFRIGVKNDTGDGEGIHICEGISNAFVVERIKGKLLSTSCFTASCQGRTFSDY